ncbi:MAG: Hsp20/alpha crystallin family protein [Thermodesulfobacteriota bacterium]
MDRFKKNKPYTFSDLERHLGRVLSHMSIPRMLPYHAVMKAPPVDMFETSQEIIIYMELPGVDPDNISVIAEHDTVTVSGERPAPSFKDTTCIHNLEIEHGDFTRTIKIPTPVNISATTSKCQNGYLIVTLPKLKTQSRIKIEVE